jgi:peptidoglycan/xylan/chitin deacetylase (PgdA/CDA1 family)
VFGLLLIAILVLDWQYGIAPIAYWVIFALFSLINFWGIIIISSQFYLSSKCKGDKSDGSIALTFDDGPVRGKTTRVLEILKHAGVPATFFCIGKNVKELPELTRQIHEAGHILANHSYSHGTWFDLQMTGAMVKELEATGSTIHQIVGKSPHFFRPPYGVTNPMLAAAVKRTGLTSIGWSVRSFDTVISDRKKLFNRVTKELKTGDIILFHDRCDSTIEILPGLLDFIKKSGLKVVPLDQLLNEKAYA